MRDFQAALNLTGRGNRSGIDVYGDGSLDQSGSLTAALRQHGMSCGDRSHGPGLDVELDGLDRHIRVVLSAEQTDSEGFRTRCPGPAIDSATLASGVMALPPPLPRQFTVALTRSTSFEDSGYTLRTMPRLRLRLTRTRVTTAYYRMPTGP